MENPIWLLVLLQASPLPGLWLAPSSALLGSGTSPSPSTRTLAWASGSDGLRQGSPRRDVSVTEILKAGLFVRFLPSHRPWARLPQGPVQTFQFLKFFQTFFLLLFAYEASYCYLYGMSHILPYKEPM